jgi:hypothetical protein
MISLTLAQAGSTSGTFTTVALLISALFGGGVLAALVQWLANRGKSTAEEAETWMRVSSGRLKTMHEEMEKLEARLHALNAELERERKIRVNKDIDLQFAVHLLLENNIEWRPPSTTGG